MHFSNRPKIKILQVIFLFFFLLQILSSCSDEKVKPVSVSIKEREIPDQESWNAKVVFSDSGQIRAILRAGHIRVFNSRNETLLDSGIQIDFFDRDEKHTSVLTANRGRVDDITNDLFAYENVVAKSDSGVILETEELIWRESVKKIVTDKFVTITSPTEKIQGYGLESDQSLKNYVIFKVSGKIQTKE